MRRCLARDIVRLPKLAALAFESLHLDHHIRHQPGLTAAVDFGLLHPVAQRLRCALILPAIKVIVGQRDGCSASWPAPSAPHARTTGENLFVTLLAIAPPSQELGPPTNPGRFTSEFVAGFDIPLRLITATVATLTSYAPTAGSIGYATNGRKNEQGS